MSAGLKFDDGKLDWSLIDDDFIAHLVPIFALGEQRYGFENWKKDFGPDYKRRFLAAMRRHYREAYKDPLAINEQDGGVYHLGQVAWNALCLLYHALQNQNRQICPEKSFLSKEAATPCGNLIKSSGGQAHPISFQILEQPTQEVDKINGAAFLREEC